MAPIVDQLLAIPDHWALVAVGNDKRPYQPEWQKNPLTKRQVEAELSVGRAVAVGVLAGPPSGGLLFVDHDGLGASQVLESIGTSLSDLPKSWAVTSGRDGRLQIIYQVPEPFWDRIKTTKLKSNVKGEQLELRWTGCQSVVIGKHPITGGYHWLKNRSPQDLPLAEAPSVLLQQMQRPIETPPLLAAANPADDAERARGYLANIPSALADDYDEWVKVGMALHSVGDDSLLADWCQWSAASSKFKLRECEQKWATFKSDSGGVGLGTLYHLAGGPSSKTAVRALNSTLGYDVTQANGKPQKYESGELLTHYRVSLGDRLRFNIYKQTVEIDGRPITDLEHYYLQLGQQNIKVSKELAADGLVFVAKENQYDPVREYLDRVADEVPPAAIDHLSTAYLRPEDAPGTLYDAMLRCTLIAAVRRVYEPGSKHDSACVLMGPQGCGKSTFWRNLGGAFFSDALRDISSKDDLMVLHSSWVMEWAELDHITGRRHAGQVKAFLSQQTDKFRVPYGKAAEDFPRRCIIVGSTNRDSGFLVDDTGNRRFWVIPVTAAPHIPVDGLLLERDAIWSAAVAAYRNGEPNHLPREFEQQVEMENESYLVSSPWQSAIETYLACRRSVSPLSSEEILTNAIEKPLERQTRGDQMQVASILKDLGWEKYRDCQNGKRQYKWRKPNLS
jgi:energy-coupling factor transporter ATP-binding protein EcfA2